MRRAILFCLLASACGPDAPPRPQAFADPIEPPSASTAPPAPVPDSDAFAAPVTLLDSRSASGGCDPNYEPCVPIDTDVDCPGGRGNGPSYAPGTVQVVGADIYDLDRDGDGIGCDR